jgi:hypothetical protein
MSIAGPTPPPPPHNGETPSNAHTTEIPLSSSSSSKTAPYPASFAEIVELITSGKPIPGIKEIKTVDRPENASKPVLPKRRKPWETDVPQAQIDGLIGGIFGDERDVHIRQELSDV